MQRSYVHHSLTCADGLQAARYPSRSKKRTFSPSSQTAVRKMPLSDSFPTLIASRAPSRAPKLSEAAPHRQIEQGSFSNEITLAPKGYLNACRLLASWCSGQGIDCSMRDKTPSYRESTPLLTANLHRERKRGVLAGCTSSIHWAMLCS
jgi:hypothetical protein